MMATTHVLAGMLVGLAVAPFASGPATPVILAGAAGGLAPDLDALGEHRRDLHFPLYGSALAAPVLTVATVAGPSWLVLAGVFVAAAALHAVTDALGGGRSLRPWEGTVDRAVYCHAHGRWWRPRRVVAYDGAPADLALATGLGLPLLALVEAAGVRWLVGGLLVVSLGYALVRRRVPDYVDALAGRVTTRSRGRETSRR